ncbi:MAG: FecR domain-containing protein [Aliarcobacter sp.]|nr:FecR domain-containing protein [Aliarcobacter sp.]
MKIIIFLLCFISIVFGEIAKVSAITGDANILRNNKKIVLQLGSLIESKDIIETQSNSKIQLIFEDNTIVTLGKNSILNINEYLYDTKNPKESKANLNFFKGTFKTITGNIGKINKEKFILRTKNATIGIRGTIIFGNQEMIACIKGAIDVQSSGKNILVNKNQITFTNPNSQPTEAQSLSTETLNTLEGEIEPTKTTTATESDSKDSETSNSTETTEKTTLEDSTFTDSKENDNVSTSSTAIENTTSTEDTTKQISSDTTSVSNEEDVKKTLSNVYTLKGYFFGAYINGADSSKSFVQKIDNFTSSRGVNNYYYDDILTRKYSTSSNNIKISASKTFTIFDKIGFDTYTNHSLVGTIPFSYTIDATTKLSGEYNVEADNTGQFFVGWYDGTPTNAGNGTSIEFNELFVSGLKTKKDEINASKIYLFKEFAWLEVKKDSNGIILSNKLNLMSIPQDKSYEYYNSYLKSFTHLAKNVFEKGATEFVSGDDSKVNAYRNEYKNDNYYNTNSYESEKATTEADISFKGSDLQGLSIAAKTTIETFDGQINNSANIGASFLDKNASVSLKNSETVNLKGFSSGLIAGDIKDYNLQSNNLSLNIDRSNGEINGSFNLENTRANANKQVSGNSSENNTDNLTLNLNGKINKLSSYYIGDDLFGVMAKNNSEFINGKTKFDLVNNSGYLLAVPDGGYDSSDNPIMLDDDSSWGYWTADFKNGNHHIYSNPLSTWVAGVQTPVSVINNLMNNALLEYNFKGNVLGNVITSNGNIENIIFDTTNKVNLFFKFGKDSNNMTGTMNFKTENTNWDLVLNKNTLDINGFSGDITSNASSATAVASSKGTFEGKFYGESDIKSVGGIFNSTNSSNDIASGVFKAVKQ